MKGECERKGFRNGRGVGKMRISSGAIENMIMGVKEKERKSEIE